MELIGLDIGFSALKGIAGNGKTAFFPSVVGEPIAPAHYSLGDASGLAILRQSGDAKYYLPVGDMALTHSHYHAGRRDASWVAQEEWMTLFEVALSELVVDSQPAKLVTGLPVSDWQAYSVQVREQVLKSFTLQRLGIPTPKTVVVLDAVVITQPYGSLLSLALSEKGELLDNVWSTGRVGVVDMGGNTLNLLAVDGLQEVTTLTLSDEFGLLHMLDRVRDDIRSEYPRFHPRTHEVAEWMVSGKFPYQGRDVDIMPFAQRYLDALITQVMTRVNEAWPESGRFSAVLLTGGGSQTIGKYLLQRMRSTFAGVQIAANARWANAHGYLRLARRIWS